MTPITRRALFAPRVALIKLEIPAPWRGAARPVPDPTGSRARRAAVDPYRVGAIAAMAHVSLIVVNLPDQPLAESRILAWRESLIDAGHTLEILTLVPTRADGLEFAQALVSAGNGLSADVIDGLGAATGDVRVVVDGSRPYHAIDLPRLIAPLLDGRAAVAVGDGGLTGWRALAALGLRPISGSADPFSRADRHQPRGL